MTSRSYRTLTRPTRPRAPRTSVASLPTLKFISDLLNQREVKPEAREGIAFLVSVAERAHEGKVKVDDPKPMTQAQGSEWIGTLQKMPVKPRDKGQATTTTAPQGKRAESEGVFEYDGAVYLVYRTRNDRLAAKVYADPNGETTVANWHEPKSVTATYAPGMMAKLREHHRAGDARVRQLGTLMHRCVDCGAELSAPESIARGKGPICAGKR